MSPRERRYGGVSHIYYDVLHHATYGRHTG